MSNSVRPHRQQPTRLPHPWDSPGKNTGVDRHFLLQCMKVKIESEVTQSCLTLHDPMDCSLPGSSVHGIFQARVLEWGAIAFSGLPHDRPINWETGGARNCDFICKASRPRRWWTTVPNNHLIQVRIQFFVCLFVLNTERGGSVTLV